MVDDGKGREREPAKPAAPADDARRAMLIERPHALAQQGRERRERERIAEIERREMERQMKEAAALFIAQVRAFTQEVSNTVETLDGALTGLHNAALQMKEVSAEVVNEMEDAWQAADDAVMAAMATVSAMDKAIKTRAGRGGTIS